MNPIPDYSDVFAQKFQEMHLSFMIDEDPMAETFEAYASNLINSWVAYTIMHDAPEVFMMMLNNISKMRRIDLVGTVAMAIAGQGFNPYGNRIPPELDAIMSVVHATPSVDLIVETFNTLEEKSIAYRDGDIIRFKHP